MAGLRPAFPRIIPTSPLGRGLVFAAMGGGYGTSTAFEASGHGNHGTLTNGPTWGSGPRGSVIDVSGGTTQVVTFPTAPVTTTPLTMFVVAKISNVAEFQVLMCVRDPSSDNNNGFELAAAGNTADDPIMALTRSQTRNAFAVKAGFVANAWFAAAAVFTSSVSRQAFFNGVGGAIETTASTPAATPGKTGIGALWHDGARGFGLYGQLDVAAIWSRALTPAEIQELYEQPFALITPPKKYYLVSGTIEESSSKSWDNANYGKRMEVEIQSANIGGNLTNFPTLIKITDGDWSVSDISFVDEKTSSIYFHANKEKSTEQHLYKTDFDGSEIIKLTDGEGTHACKVIQNGNYFFDKHSSITQPTQLVFYNLLDNEKKTIADSRLPEMNKYDLAKVELFTIPTEDGYDLPSK